MINIKSIVEIFRQGGLELDCSEIKLFQANDGGIFFKGPGYIRQTPDGAITFRIYVAEHNCKLQNLSSALAPPVGQLVGDDCFFHLEATSFGGTVWTASQLLPSYNWRLLSDAVIVYGEIASLEARTESIISRETVRLYFFEEFNLPLTDTSQTTSDGVTTTSLDRAKFTACGAHFDVHVLKNSGLSTIEASSPLPLPEAFDLRIQEAIQFFVAKLAYWRARTIIHNGICTLTLASPVKTGRTQQCPPIAASSSGFHTHGWVLFSKFLEYVMAHTEGWHLNPVAYQLRNACETTGNSIDAWALGVSIAVEAVASLVPLEQDHEQTKRLENFQRAVAEYFEELPEFREFIPRLRGLVDTMGTKRPKDTLLNLAREGLVDARYVKAWNDLRNRQAHPSIDDLRTPQPINFQKQFDRIQRTEVLLRQITFHLIGYTGPYTDYGQPNYPTQNYPLIPTSSETDPTQKDEAHSKK